ncbi:MAG: metallophosphoesterase family protein [Methanomassiliicoccales archaeon]
MVKTQNLITRKMKLNDEAYLYLRVRREEPKYQGEFSLVFVGDSHLGQKCINSIKPEVMYEMLLKRIVNNQNKYGNILAIIHGGDATHSGKEQLERFITVTRNQLAYNQSGSNPIPLFMNVGNHEYQKDPLLYNYNSLVSNGRYVDEIWLRPQNACVLLLNTGGPDSDGHFTEEQQFPDQLAAMEAIIKAHPHYRFIIDMHIPPAIGPHKGKSHALKPKYSDQFIAFLNRYLQRVAAVVTHHRHCIHPSSLAYYYRGKVPIYITAFAGHCDCARLNGLKLTYTCNQQGIWKAKSSLL